MNDYILESCMELLEPQASLWLFPEQCHPQTLDGRQSPYYEDPCPEERQELVEPSERPLSAHDQTFHHEAMEHSDMESFNPSVAFDWSLVEQTIFESQPLVELSATQSAALNWPLEEQTISESPPLEVSATQSAAPNWPLEEQTISESPPLEVSATQSAALNWPLEAQTNSEISSLVEVPATRRVACDEKNTGTTDKEQHIHGDSPQVTAVEYLGLSRSLRPRKHLESTETVDWKSWEQTYYQKLDSRLKQLQQKLNHLQRENIVNIHARSINSFGKKCEAMIKAGLAGKRIRVSRVNNLQAIWTRCRRSQNMGRNQDITKALKNVLIVVSFIEGIFEHGTTYR